jgi:hypothetical protein
MKKSCGHDDMDISLTQRAPGAAGGRADLVPSQGESMALGMIHRLIQVLAEAARGLGQACQCADIEQLAVMVHRIMTFQSRQFHTLEHVFGFIDEGTDPHTILAAVFHDLVYYQVDGGIQAEARDLVTPYLILEDNRIRLDPAIPAGDTAYQACRAVFDFRPDQEMGIYSGLNEFLSTLAMMSLLRHHLPVKDLVAVAVCIEASIPFRGPNQRGLEVGDELERRLDGIASAGLLPLEKDEIFAMVGRAIDFANRDVKDFALGNPARFLNNTWKLLPETNSALRQSGTYTIRQYRMALGKQLGFFQSLDPAQVFHRYRGVPAEPAFARMSQGATRNLEIANAYLQAKLLAVALVEALALETGGDAPIALFMGDLPHRNPEVEKLEDHLPKNRLPVWIDQQAPVYRLLKTGRLDEPDFDLKHSPLALFLYENLQPAEWHRLVMRQDDFFKERITPRQFLELCPATPRNTVAAACARMVQTRRERLETLLSGPLQAPVP